MLGVGSGDLGVSEELDEGYEIPSYPDGPVVFLNPVLLDHVKPYFAITRNAASGSGIIKQDRNNHFSKQKQCQSLEKRENTRMPGNGWF